MYGNYLDDAAKIVEQLNDWVDRQNNGTDTYLRWEVSAQTGLPQFITK